MAKYASYADLSREATEKYTRKATGEAYRAGLAKVAPSGKRPREARVANYANAVSGKGPVWLREWEAKMFE
jgi:transcriptional regulator of nitric oxide reductase